MEQDNTSHVLTIVTFIGIILFFAIYFSFSATLGFEVDTSVGELSDCIILKSFADAVYRNKEQNESIKYYNYKLFSVLDGYDVIIGKNDFLFETVSEDGEYNYLLDYLGESQFTREQLDVITKSLRMRAQAYKNLGIEYVVAVVPNSHTVYCENLPSYFSNIEPDTRFMQLTDYIKKNTDINFINLSDTMIENKSAGILYNNTENSINSLGAYFAYKEIFENIPEELTKKIIPNELDSYEYCSYLVKGKSLSQKVGLENFIKNNTISLSAQTLLNYTNRYDGYEYTIVDEEYKDIIPIEPFIIVECSDDWNKTQFMPYFSNTFFMVTYKSSYTFNKTILDNQNVDCVIQIINEDELLSIADENVTMSYTVALKPEENLFVSAIPSIISRITTSPDVVTVIGLAEEGAIISVIENGVETNKVKTIDGRFIISCYLGESTHRTIGFLAKVEGKKDSVEMQINLVKNNNAITNDGVVVGENSQLYSSIAPNNLFDNERITRLNNLVINSMEEFNQKNGYYPDFYCFPVPEKVRILQEDLPESLIYTEQALVGSNVILNELTCEQINMIDASKSLTYLKYNNKLFMHTYSSLTDLGAFYCYRYIAEKLDLVKSNDKIIDISSYKEDYVYIKSGELIKGLNFDDYLIMEKAVDLVPSFTRRAVFSALSEGEFDISEAFVSKVDDDRLPFAIIIREDNSADNIFPFLAEHFSKMIVLDADVSHQCLVEFCISQSPDMILYFASSNIAEN